MNAIQERKLQELNDKWGVRRWKELDTPSVQAGHQDGDVDVEVILEDGSPRYIHPKGEVT